jgi:hypothetical protein
MGMLGMLEKNLGSKFLLTKAIFCAIIQGPEEN